VIVPPVRICFLWYRTKLRRVARHCLVGQCPDHTLQSTALMHEAYLRLVDLGGALE
jgi:hypothetical protein